MHLVYMDDSKDERHSCFSALIMPADRWQEALDYLIAFRRRLKAERGIFTTIELHATDWLGGRGRVANRTVRRDERAEVYVEFLRCIAGLPDCQIINACGARRDENQLFERICNRVQTNMAHRDSRAIIISDEGKSFDGLVRRLRRHNPIRGRFGGVLQRPLNRIVEDPVYRKSDRSLFVQAADFCAFSLLRMEAPTPAIQQRGIENAFLELEPILVKQAFAADPRGLGIIR